MPQVPVLYNPPWGDLDEADLAALQDEILALTASIDLDEERLRLEGSLIEFMKAAWPVIDAAPLSLNWHHMVIAEHLEAVSRGEIRSLLINQPPRPVCTDQLVLTRDRGNVPLGNISVGDLVLTHLGRWREVEAVHEQGSLDCVRVTARRKHLRKRSLDLAPDHPVMTPQGWVNAGELQPNDLICVVPGEGQAFDEIVYSVTPIGKKPCRCLTVAEDASFTAQGVAVSNTTKTLLTSVLFPSWVWTQREIGPLTGPQVSFLCVSYGSTLAEDIARKMLNLVQSEWYQRRWPHVQILQDQRGRAYFGNNHGGERISVGITGAILGRGADILLADDVQTRREADSAAERLSTLQGMADLSTRVTSAKHHAQVMVCQRLGVDDASNYCLEHWKDVVHVMLPARFEPNRCCEADIRSYENELLWPEAWPEAELRKVELGLIGVDGGNDALSNAQICAQLQQAPIPPGGSIISRQSWMVYPEETPAPGDLKRDPVTGLVMVTLPPVSTVIMSLDTAYSDKEGASFSACTVWGIWHRRSNLVSGKISSGADRPWYAERWSAAHDAADELARIEDEGAQPRVVLMEGWRMRAPLNSAEIDPKNRKPKGLVQRVIETAKRRKADRLVIENKSRGLDVKNEIERQLGRTGMIIDLWDPRGRGDKTQRLHAASVLFSPMGNGLVYCPANLTIKRDRWGFEIVEVGEFEWANAILNEVNDAPHSKYSDFADTVSMALIYLRTNGFLDLTDEYIARQLEARMHVPRRRSIAEEYGIGTRH